MGPCRPFSVAPCVLQSVRPSLRWSLTLTKRKVYQVSRCIPQHDNRQISFEVETSTARSGSSLQVTQSAVTNGETISADNHSIGVRQNNFGLKETSWRQYSERRLPPYYSVVGRSARVALAQDVTTNSDSCRVTDNSPRILYTFPLVGRAPTTARAPLMWTTLFTAKGSTWITTLEQSVVEPQTCQFRHSLLALSFGWALGMEPHATTAQRSTSAEQSR